MLFRLKTAACLYIQRHVRVFLANLRVLRIKNLKEGINNEKDSLKKKKLDEITLE